MASYKIEKKKILFVADFKPSVDFFQKQHEIIKELQADFPNWEASGLDFTMQDKEIHCSGSFSSKKIVFEFEETSGKTDTAKKRIINGLKVYNSHLPIDSFGRLGIRFFMFIPMQDIKKEELTDVIKSKLFSDNKELSDIFSEKASDLAYILDYSKDEYFYHFKCGPMPKEHIPAWVDFGDLKNRFKNQKDAKEYLESFPEMSIFLDFDCYKKNIPFMEFERFLNKSFEECSHTSKKLKNYILGEK